MGKNKLKKYLLGFLDSHKWFWFLLAIIIPILIFFITFTLNIIIKEYRDIKIDYEQQQMQLGKVCDIHIPNKEDIAFEVKGKKEDHHSKPKNDKERAKRIKGTA